MDLELSIEEIFEYRSLCTKFARGSLQAYMQPEYADGNLEQLPKILDEAREIGLLSDSENGYGVWGYDLNKYPYASQWLLAILSEVCAGAAMCFHQNGLASNILRYLVPDNGDFPVRLILAIQEGNFLPQPRVLKSKELNKPVFETLLVRENGHWLLKGAKHFVYSLPGNEAYLIFAQNDQELAAVVLEAAASGLQREPLQQRLGLLACRVEHLTFNDVKIDDNAVFLGHKVYTALLRALFLNWLGIAAVALGTAKGAIKAAKDYIKERYQGGTTIENHAAIQSLITSAEVNSFAAEAQINQRWRLDNITMEDVRQSAMMKLSLTKLCTQAVSDSLQCFGGYGYMEDYGMEKRYRDVNTLNAMGGTPLYLKRLIFELGREE